LIYLQNELVVKREKKGGRSSFLLGYLTSNWERGGKEKERRGGEINFLFDTISKQKLL